MTTLHQIDDFLHRKRLAVVGVSRNPRDFTRSVFDELRRRNYDVVPVNPAVTEVEGIPCHASVQDITPPVEGALLMTKPAVTNNVVRECADAGIRQIWLYRAGGTGAVSPDALTFCEARGMSVVAGECPFMFFPDTQWFHRAHGFCRKLFGKYPS
ncbi:MAG TPA: CoA-binding protein [Bryobacteraceae bacterium]|nr:CoA-binding protein [Bryobacteraceae bacterium]